MKRETREEQLARIREAWKPIQAKLNEERKWAVQKTAQQASAEAAWKNTKGRGTKAMNTVLRRFHKSILAMESDADRLNALISIANRFPLVGSMKHVNKTRRRFERNKTRLLTIRGKSCIGCSRPATLRHHIIPLQRAGRNEPINLVPLCDVCHCQIHIWLDVPAEFLEGAAIKEVHERVMRECDAEC